MHCLVQQDVIGQAQFLCDKMPEVPIEPSACFSLELMCHHFMPLVEGYFGKYILVSVVNNEFCLGKNQL
jgi:hypothetical protein